jgi:nucleoside-diphosphate-sugar epimerase
MIFQAYGPGQPEHTLVPSAVRAAVAGDDFPMTSGRQERDWVYVDDIVKGLTAAFNKAIPPGTTVDLGPGRTTPVIEVVEKIFSLTHSSGRPLPGVLPERPGEEHSQAADAQATARLTGWQAETSLEQGLRLLPNL